MLLQRVLALALAMVLTSCATAQGESSTTASRADSTTTAPHTSSAPYVQPDPEESALAFVACVEAHGFTAELQPDGSVLVESDPEQIEVFREVMDKCRRESMGLDGPAPQPTAEQVEQFYEGLVDLSDCLEDQGYDISEPPSLEAFIEGGMDSWDPLGEVLAIHDLSPSKLDELNGICPQPQLYSPVDD